MAAAAAAAPAGPSGGRPPTLAGSRMAASGSGISTRRRTRGATRRSSRPRRGRPRRGGPRRGAEERAGPERERTRETTFSLFCFFLVLVSLSLFAISHALQQKNNAESREGAQRKRDVGRLLREKVRREGERQEQGETKEQKKGAPPLCGLTFFFSPSPFFFVCSFGSLYALGRGPCSRAQSATATREQRAPSARPYSRLCDRGGS